jgi:hypothetical protein
MVALLMVPGSVLASTMDSSACDGLCVHVRVVLGADECGGGWVQVCEVMGIL